MKNFFRELKDYLFYGTLDGIKDIHFIKPLKNINNESK